MTVMAAKIRALDAGDAEALAELRLRALTDSPLAFLASPEDDFASSIESTRDVVSRAAESPVFGAWNEQLVGMVGLYRDRHVKAAHKVHIWGMYVRPESRKRGLGRRLLDAALEYARGIETVRVAHIGVTDNAADAKSLYVRAGFRVWGEEPEALCHKGQCVREFHMVLTLK